MHYNKSVTVTLSANIASSKFHLKGEIVISNFVDLILLPTGNFQLDISILSQRAVPAGPSRSEGARSAEQGERMDRRCRCATLRELTDLVLETGQQHSYFSACAERRFP